MEHMADGLKENYDEEAGAKENLARQLNKALGDADMWKQKYEIDGIAKAEELEMAKVCSIYIYVPKKLRIHIYCTKRRD